MTKLMFIKPGKWTDKLSNKWHYDMWTNEPTNDYSIT